MTLGIHDIILYNNCCDNIFIASVDVRSPLQLHDRYRWNIPLQALTSREIWAAAYECCVYGNDAGDRLPHYVHPGALFSANLI